jgi:hypothetical protein
MTEPRPTAPASHIPMRLDPGEDVWAQVSLPHLTLVATDRRLLSRRAGRTEAWSYDDIRQVGSAGVDGDVVISFHDGQRPLVIHAAGDDATMQALTIIALLVARARRSVARVPLQGSPAG